MSEQTLEQALKEMATRDKNFLAFVETLQSIYDSSDESVDLLWEKTDGVTISRTIPSLGNLIGRIKNLELNIDGMSNVSVRNPRIIMANGEIRPIYLSDPIQTPKAFSFTNNVTKYTLDENALKDKLFNPSMFIPVTIDKSIYSGYKSFDYRKIVFEDDNDSVTFFNNIILNNTLKYIDLIDILGKQQIPYNIVNSTTILNSKDAKEVGIFSVLNVRKGINESDNKYDILYALNTIRYKTHDNRDLSLKVGHKVVSNKTVYEITRVKEDTREISVRAIEGNMPILKGVDVLELQSETVDNDVRIPIGGEVRFILFIKPINPNASMVNADWGTGKPVYLYDLTDALDNKYEDGLTQNLWNGLEAISENTIKPSRKIMIPSTPIVLESSFNVQIINLHKKNIQNESRLSKLQNRKAEILSKIDSIDISIKGVRSELATLNINDINNSNRNIELTQKVNKFIEDKEIYSKELKSISDEVLDIGSVEEFFTPKYGAVGIIPFPEPKYENAYEKTGRQDIVGIELEYRYLSNLGVADELATTVVKTSENTKERASISRWVKYPIQLRKRNLNGEFSDESISDPDINSPNQFSISITPNEYVEVRARSISDAAFPIRTIVSEWSDPLKIKFPEEISKQDNSLAKGVDTEKIRRELSDEFNRRGLENHAQDAFTNKDKSFVHSAKNIATEEKTPEQGNKDLQTVLNEMKVTMANLESRLSTNKGELQVRLLDENGIQVAVIKNNSTTNIDGGLYSELVKGLNKPKGEILNKTYTIEISNTTDGELELLSYVAGNNESPLRADYDGYVHNKNEFVDFRKYFLVPQVLTDLSAIDYNSTTFGRFFQNKQTQGQIIYSRYRDVSLNKSLYKDGVNNYANNINIGSSQAFIWGMNNNLSGGGVESDFSVHTLHPSLPEVIANWSEYLLDGSSFKLKRNNNGVKYITNPFMHSKYSYLDTKQVDHDKQSEYTDYTSYTNSPMPESQQIKKISFDNNDKYLIGRKTCGLYFGLAPRNKDNNSVVSKYYNTGQKLAKSEKVLIPILASSRLTDFFGDGDTGIGRIGGINNAQNIRFEKKIGLDILVKLRDETALFSFDLRYGIQYQNSGL